LGRFDTPFVKSALTADAVNLLTLPKRFFNALLKPKRIAPKHPFIAALLLG